MRKLSTNSVESHPVHRKNASKTAKFASKLRATSEHRQTQTFDSTTSPPIHKTPVTLRLMTVENNFCCLCSSGSRYFFLYAYTHTSSITPRCRSLAQASRIPNVGATLSNSNYHESSEHLVKYHSTWQRRLVSKTLPTKG